eukprot:998042-Pyramimonas_sp.AAC.1
MRCSLCPVAKTNLLRSSVQGDVREVDRLLELGAPVHAVTDTGRKSHVRIASRCSNHGPDKPYWSCLNQSSISHCTH